MVGIACGWTCCVCGAAVAGGVVAVGAVDCQRCRDGGGLVTVAGAVVVGAVVVRVTVCTVVVVCPPPKIVVFLGPATEPPNTARSR